MRQSEMLGDGLAAGWGKVGPSHRQARGENIPVLPNLDIFQISPNILDFHSDAH